MHLSSRVTTWMEGGNRLLKVVPVLHKHFLKGKVIEWGPSVLLGKGPNQQSGKGKELLVSILHKCSKDLGFEVFGTVKRTLAKSGSWLVHGFFQNTIENWGGMWYAAESLQELVGVGVKDTGILLLSLLFVVLGMEFKVSCTFGKCSIPEPQPQHG